MYFFKLKELNYEKIPVLINNYKVNRLLDETKADIVKNNYKLINSKFYKNFSLQMLELNFNIFNKDQQDYFNEKIFSKINKCYLYEFYIQNLCYFSSKKNFNNVDNLLESVMNIKLVKSADIIKNDKSNSCFEFLLNDDSKIRFSNIPLEIDELEECNGKCHFITPEFCELLNADYIDIVLEPNSMYKGHYHSFCVKDNAVFDFAHNIVIDYDNYIKLINPIILVHEPFDEYNKNIEILNNDNNFTKSKYYDLVKYAMTKQKIFK